MDALIARGHVAGLTIGRILLGVVLVAHGWQKLSTNGIDGVQMGFEKMGAPLPELSAWFAAVVELVGGAALIVGVLVPVVAILGIIDMIGAIFVAHWSAFTDSGSILATGGPEVPLLVIAGLAAVGFAAQGPLSVDHYVFGARRSAAEKELVAS